MRETDFKGFDSAKQAADADLRRAADQLRDVNQAKDAAARSTDTAADVSRRVLDAAAGWTRTT